MTATTDAQAGAGAVLARFNLHPAQLFHVGVVADDIDAAMAELSGNLGLTWKGGRPRASELCLYGEDRQVEMRIAHSIQGPPHIELLQAVPDTPWTTPSHGAHHLCYWSADSDEVCQALEAAGNRRILGKAGTASGYFLTPGGMIIEIIGEDLRDHLSAWFRGELTR